MHDMGDAKESELLERVTDEIDDALRISLQAMKNGSQQFRRSNTKKGKDKKNNTNKYHRDYMSVGINGCVKALKADEIDFLIVDTGVQFAEGLKHKLQRLVTLSHDKRVRAAISHNLSSIYKQAMRSSCFAIGIKKLRDDGENPFKPLRSVLSRQNKLMSELLRVPGDRESSNGPESGQLDYVIDGSKSNEDGACNSPMASAASATGEEMPEDLKMKVVEFHERFCEARAGVESVVGSGSLAEVRRALPGAVDRARFDTTNLYALNSLWWMYLATQGVEPRAQAGLRGELERVRDYMRRVKVIEDKPLAPKVDKGAAGRFIRNALWDPTTTRPKKKAKTGDKPADPHTAPST